MFFLFFFSCSLLLKRPISELAALRELLDLLALKSLHGSYLALSNSSSATGYGN